MPEITPLPLNGLTTLRTGAAPRRMFDAATDDELLEALHAVWADGDSWFVLGGGSNLFAGDQPFDGSVVRVRTAGIEELPIGTPGRVRLRARAGHSWDDLVAFSVSRGLRGLEALSGIPGTVGGAPIQNIGAYGQEVVQTLVEVELIDEGATHPVTVPAAELGLAFRTSALKRPYRSVPARRAVITSATFELVEDAGEPRPILGPQLRSALRLAENEAVTLPWVRDTILSVRRSKGMLLDEDAVATDPDTHSAGSFFQNAIVSESFARTLPPECPRWPVHPDEDNSLVIPLSSYDGVVPPIQQTKSEVKVSSAWLIEHSGFEKGFHLPRSRAGLSTKHALALTNRGGATAEEIAELARYIQARVQSEFGLLLQPEPVLVGVDL